MTHSIGLSTELHSYLMMHSVRESTVVRLLREESSQHPRKRMQIAPEQGQLLAFLVRLIQARVVMEIGVFLGYSSLWIAEALPDEGRLIALDNNTEFTAVADRYWKQAGLRNRIDLRIGEALQTLDQLERTKELPPLDMVFIDADKESYRHYYEACMRLTRTGGLIAIDNVLMNGDVTRLETTDPRTTAIQQFNRVLACDQRIDLVMLPCGDGLTVARKR
jgi:predicted O-methyltransferase YrrM